MKDKNLRLTKIVFLVAVIAMVIAVVICGIAKKPTVTQGEFPYSVTYSVKGEVKTLEGVYKAQFVGKTENITVAKNGATGNEIDAISSATITSKAVTNAVNTAIVCYQEWLGGSVNE